MTPNIPTVAALIPARDAGDTLARAIESVLAQTVAVAEIIVIDDDSSDDTRRIAQSFDGVWVIAGEGRGVAAARNVGLHASRADWVALLDADDEWLPRHVASLAAAISTTPRAAACFAAAIHVDAAGRLLNRATVDGRHATLEGLLRRRLQPTTSAVAVRREPVLDVEGFDEGFRRAAGVEDLDLWWRLAARWPCVVSTAETVRYFVHEDRDRARTAADLADLAADRRRCIERLRASVSPELFRDAAAQHHAIMARYWYVAELAREGRREARASLRYAVTVNGLAALAFGLLPSRPRMALRTARRSAITRGA